MARAERSWIGKVPVAHRGLHDADDARPENTLAAIKAAIEAGFAVEIDVQLSADGRAVVFHDETLDRLTSEEGRLDARTAAQLSRIKIADTRETIPTLARALETVAGRAPVYIEIKHAGPSDWALERAVAADLEGYEGPVAAMSFEPTSLRALSIVKPELTRGIVAEARGGDTGLGIWKRFSRRHLLHLPATQPHFIAYNVHDMPAPVPVLANTLTGMPLLVWTVRTPQERERADLVGAQMIFEGFTP